MITMLDCGDQEIQADTPHLFEHLDLAPHFIDSFINATETQSTDNGSSCNDSTNYEEDEFNGDSYMGGIAFFGRHAQIRDLYNVHAGTRKRLQSY